MNLQKTFAGAGSGGDGASGGAIILNTWKFLNADVLSSTSKLKIAGGEGGKGGVGGLGGMGTVVFSSAAGRMLLIQVIRTSLVSLTPTTR